MLLFFFLKTKGLAKAHTPLFKKETPTFKTELDAENADLLPEVFTSSGLKLFLSEFDAISRNLLYCILYC